MTYAYAVTPNCQPERGRAKKNSRIRGLIFIRGGWREAL
jgi:hypothetical protein